MAVVAHQVGWRRALVHDHRYRAGTVEGGDAGGNTGAGVELLRQRRGLGVEQRTAHRLQVETVAKGRRHRQADHAAGVTHHEIDGFRRRLLRGDDEIAFVFAVLVIDEDDHAALVQLLQGFLNGAESFGIG